MEDTTKKRIVQLLQSGEEEMCNLAVNIFCGITRQYYDYWEVRTAYKPNEITVSDRYAKAAFEKMFNALHTESIMQQYMECVGGGSGHIKDAMRTSLNSKQKRKQYKDNFKKAKKIYAKE